MSAALRWDPDVPDEVRTLVAPILDEWLWLVPPWCVDIHIGWEADNGASMRCRASYEDRWARIAVCGNWLTQDPDVRVEHVLHELFHILTWPVTDVVDGLLEDTENEPYKAAIKRQWESALETVVNDLSHRMTRGRSAES